ncbi:unnamed protein product [Heligmosomoides polygyrus]|uniref:Uncharacterized protein n=1 Tax=Heligmosomoides polygyrus TaxID=6339 RepID=A0A183GMX2_HELPZ|nr:unnamed protein product [Heligmosomoides polygyrus]
MFATTSYVTASLPSSSYSSEEASRPAEEETKTPEKTEGNDVEAADVAMENWRLDYPMLRRCGGVAVPVTSSPLRGCGGALRWW